MKIDNNHNRSFFGRTLTFIFFSISMFLVLSANLTAMESTGEESEEERLYKQGIKHRDDKNWVEAVKCFQPLTEHQLLAEQMILKAEHNLAFCFFNLGEEMEAYEWYQNASDRGFEPSTRNLRRMNLFYLLLPNELIAHIVTFFSMKDVLHFSLVAWRSNWSVGTAVTGTNFLNSKSPFAVECFSWFVDVQFEPKPKKVRLVRSAKVTKGSIEVHFRDSKHLKRIVKETPLIKAHDRLYFVHDDKAEDHKELVPTEGDLQAAYFINFEADTPLKASGTIQRQLSCPMHFPMESDINGLTFKGGGVNTGDLRSLSQAHVLAEVFDTFDEYLFNIRTRDAHQLLKDRQESRRKSPHMYPSLEDLCPDVLLIGSPTINILQKDYISSKQPFIYISNSIPGIDALQGELPEFSQSISYINPSCKKSGVYCNGPLILQKGFEVRSDGNLTVGGKIGAFDYNLLLASKKSIWAIGTEIISRILVFDGKESITILPFYTQREANIKPEGMPENHWENIINFLSIIWGS